MDAVYDLAAKWAAAGHLPEPFGHAFMLRGLLAALLIGPLLGAIGALVVTRRLVFFTQTVGQASLTGVALGLLFGEAVGATYGGTYGFCLLVAFAMLYLRQRSGASADTIVGVVLAQVLGLGIVMLVLVTRRFDVHQVEAVLFGSLITVTDLDLAILAGTGIVVAALLARFFNAVMLVSFNPALARLRGFDPLLLDYLFVTLVTVIVVAGLKMVGALLVLVLIVLPAAAARNLARSLTGFFWASIGFGTLGTVSGLLISAVWPIPTGGAIVLAASLLFYATLVLKLALRPGASPQA